VYNANAVATKERQAAAMRARLRTFEAEYVLRGKSLPIAEVCDVDGRDSCGVIVIIPLGVGGGNGRESSRSRRFGNDEKVGGRREYMIENKRQCRGLKIS
jgi:hypothetical protein